MGTLKYINLLLHPDIHLQRVKYIINEQSMNINVFLLVFRFSSNWERERGYIKLGIRRNGLKVYLSFFLWWTSCGEYFLFYGLIDFMLFLILAWRTWLLRVRDIFLSSSTRSTGVGSVCHEPCPTTNFFLFYFCWREGVTTSVLGSQPIVWLLPSSFPCQATRGRSPSTNICSWRSFFDALLLLTRTRGQ